MMAEHKVERSRALLKANGELSAHGVRLTRGSRAVLRDVQLSIRPGELLGLLGANGAGKSTLLSVLAGELKALPRAGAADTITLDGRALQSYTTKELARRRAVLPQSMALNFDLSVLEVVTMGTYAYPELSETSVRDIAQQALSRADASALDDRRYPELSGGEQQRVHLARVIAQVLAGRQTRPDVHQYLLLDEPTASLDPYHQHHLMDVVQQLTRHADVGALVIVHDVNLAARWCDRIAFMLHGTIQVCDQPMHAITPSTLRSVYGMDAHVLPHPADPTIPQVVFG